MTHLPPFILTSDSNSFARKTIVKRQPYIIQQVIENNSFPEEALKKLETLINEMREGVIVDPIVQWEIDTSLFNEDELKRWYQKLLQYANQPWLNIPWYFAETFFYLKLLCAIGYYDRDSPFFFKDPFQVLKERELFTPGTGIKVARELAKLLHRDTQRGEKSTVIVHKFIHFSLWGNNIDLSNYEIADHSRENLLKSKQDNLLIDQSELLLNRLYYTSRVDFILDNCGPELVCDLFLALIFLSLSTKRKVVFHLKRSPFFVSDSMKKDVEMTIRTFSEDSDKLLSEYGRLLMNMQQENRLCLMEHFFWNGPDHFPDFPKDLQDELSASDFILLKGDVNYRRLISDRKWHHSTDMESITGYFPASFAVLRTLKSEIVVDIPHKIEGSLEKEDPHWLINGKRGIIRTCLV